MIDYYLKKVGIPEKYIKATLKFNDFNLAFQKDMGFRLKEIYRKSFKVISERKFGLYLCGTNGTGKSYLACALLRYCKQFLNLSVTRTTAQEIIDWYFDNFQGYRSRWLSADILLIEELGREVNFKYDQKIKIIENLIKMRNDSSGKITMFTSNCTIEEIEKQYSKYLYNLISGTCVVFNFPGEDLRNILVSRYTESL